MAAREVYRYVDRRGDSIIFKFDPALINDPTDGPLSVYHVWRHETKTTTQWSSMLLDRISAAERWQADKKPITGLLLWQGEVNGKQMVVRFVGFEKAEKGWMVESPGRFA
ncbi:hypothetical protein PMIN06_006748 [Paraphaeosphaeria minitans]|uniref:Uncharacterized protein n=1 Tax=Paraphaeosphaeria minitans TaxID=565426 RepID=A0A9P6KUV2_9PLEO|nr:hypothetical protein PMIN01_02381 [Paraphaeosphaeria minitans]